MKQKNTTTVSGHTTRTCLMPWIVSNDGLTACTILAYEHMFMLRIAVVVGSQNTKWADP